MDATEALDALRKREREERLALLSASLGLALRCGGGGLWAVGVEKSPGKVGGWMISCVWVSVRMKVNSGAAGGGSCAAGGGGGGDEAATAGPSLLSRSFFLSKSLSGMVNDCPVDFRVGA